MKPAKDWFCGPLSVLSPFLLFLRQDRRNIEQETKHRHDLVRAHSHWIHACRLTHEKEEENR